jgi:hypothetical protein
VGGIWQKHHGARANGDGTPFDMVKRGVGVTQSPEQAGAFGNDWMQGNDGEDEGAGPEGRLPGEKLDLDGRSPGQVEARG